MPLLIGTSGWQYADWRDRVYPTGVPQRLWLEYYAERFDTVEVNNAFYRLPERATFEQWRERTGEGFVVAVKASRFLTHVKRLADPEEPVARLLERAGGLGDRLGPILLQLPPNLRVDLGRLDRTLRCFPPSVRVAVEPRHDSWFSEELFDLLEERSVALCLADSPHRRTPLRRTTDWGYVRFHQGRASPSPCYGRAALTSWARRLAELWPPSADVFAFFNNDPLGCAVRDAARFAGMSRRAGLEPTRVPSVRCVRVG
jgi:uncharacterized protein YecE (DUF72 family)